MKLYTAAEKRAQLEQFVTSLRKAIGAADVAKELAQSFTPVIWVHKEWLPPLIRNADGSLAEPEWFVRMSAAHGRAEKLALELRAHGER